MSLGPVPCLADSSHVFDRHWSCCLVSTISDAKLAHVGHLRAPSSHSSLRAQIELILAVVVEILVLDANYHLAVLVVLTLAVTAAEIVIDRVETDVLHFTTPLFAGAALSLLLGYAHSPRC